MNKTKFAIVVAVGCGLLLLLSIVLCIVTVDQSLIVITVLFGVLYTFFLVKLVGVLKKKKHTQTRSTSPLMNRRR